MRKLAVVLGVILLALVATYVYFLNADKNVPEVQVQSDKTYQNDRYGISFTYPNDYILSEGERGAEGSGHYAIVLVRQEDAAPRENSEGPPGITIDIYQDAGHGLIGWLKNSDQSNFKLSDGTFASTTVSGADAVSYHWSGLYEAEDTAFIHNGNVISVAVTHITNTDPQIADYRKLLASFNLASPASDIYMPATFTGVTACLPPSATSTQSSECAFGIRAQDGNYYALDMIDIVPEQRLSKTGIRVSVHGMLVPIEAISSDVWRKYDVKGIVHVTEVTKL